MRVAFTGTRKGMTPAQRRQLRDVCYALRTMDEFHHGGAVGADTQAAEFVSTANYLRIVEHPAAGDPLARNRAMVEACDLLIAAPETNREVLRSGTWATVRYARKLGKPVVMLSRGEP
jgi:nucleoside 2-deoxyribosyltransferase